ncbi:hypothetical protein OIC43_09595 [Streptomyces sp. NBC_00825]|uniref:hypothetical protein n=1 Tax=unclassified Streptomyces TaxID=2593676 RepID=UPI002ED1BF89|nr:hypothetical protein OG832_34100 [Streptomyces sp. NBC_00826]WTH89275.1 hypothetical protein OIC43_09595 [Streptomyces sp. NBC_00825]WTH98000.1 hypothetical protein OHA23_09580 [Streptomyces sp. NBC_00822]
MSEAGETTIAVELAVLGNGAAALCTTLRSKPATSWSHQLLDIVTAQDLAKKALSLFLTFSEQPACTRPEGRQALAHLGRVAESAQVVSAELTAALARKAENARIAALRNTKPIFIGPSPAQRVAVAVDLLAKVPAQCAEGAKWVSAAERLQAARDRAASTTPPTPAAASTAPPRRH